MKGQVSCYLIWRIIKESAEFLETEAADTVDLSSLPHLQHLTVHAEVYFKIQISGETWCTSFLPTAVETIKTAPSVQELRDLC